MLDPKGFIVEPYNPPSMRVVISHLTATDAHHWYLTLDDSHPTLDRIDVILYRYGTATGSIAIGIRKGTPSRDPGLPVRPSTDEYVYTPIAYIHVHKAATAIYPGSITPVTSPETA